LSPAPGGAVIRWGEDALCPTPKANRMTTSCGLVTSMEAILAWHVDTTVDWSIAGRHDAAVQCTAAASEDGFC
jgi:hypothetical protein